MTKSQCQDEAILVTPSMGRARLCLEVVLHLLDLVKPLYLCHALAAHGRDGARELVGVVQCLHVVAAAYTPAVDHDVRHGSSTGQSREGELQARSELVLVEFDDIWRWYDRVLVEEDVL